MILREMLVEDLDQVMEIEQGINTIHLEVRAGNETAVRLYERMGFTRDGIRKGYYERPVEDAILMTRHPDPAR